MTSKIWQEFAQKIFYHAGDIGKSEDFDHLCKFLDDLEKSPDSTRIYYLATAPRFYEPAIENLGKCGLCDGEQLPAARDHRKAVRHRSGFGGAAQ